MGGAARAQKNADNYRRFLCYTTLRKNNRYLLTVGILRLQRMRRP
jgi:hypothetical protein